MNKRPPYPRGLETLLLFALLTTGCQAQTSGASVWIDAPINALSLATPQTLPIEGHASSPEGIARVEIYVNEALLAEVSDLPGEGTLFSYQTSWTPEGPGEYRIMVIAYGTNGTASAPDTALVVIGRVTEIPEISPTWTPTLPPTPTFTPTTPPPAETVIEFRADPETIAAGECSDLHWNVSNALKVVFGGTERPLSGSDSVCTCENQQYPLKVTHMDGQEEIVYVQVSVTGTCTPTDSDPPPAPSQAVPANGLSIGCRASQTLTWLPVSDPSGIAEYQVEVQRSSDNATWSNAPGSPITGLSDKTTSISTECGWYYRWRVRAVDGAGNVGNWSGWSTFSITLG